MRRRNDGHRVAYNRAFEDLGLNWYWSIERYGELLAVAGGKERIAAFIAADNPPRSEGDPLDLAARIHRRKAERFSEIAHGIHLRPGVRRLVAEAWGAGLKLAVATTAGEDGVRAVLGNTPGVLAAFELIAAGDVVPRKKPAPDIYIYTLARLGLCAAEALAFEDSTIGLVAASAAGIRTVVTPSVYTTNQAFATAAAVLTSLGDEDECTASLAGPAPRGVVDLAFLRGLSS